MILELLVEVLIICGIGLYLRSYLKKKGENLATKEDVELITDKVEGVRSEYAERFEKIAQGNRLLLEQTKQQHELSLAAIDKRLKIHQKAFSLSAGLFLGLKLSEDQRYGLEIPTPEECFAWWITNCLYLSGESRRAFIEMCFSKDEDKIFDASQTIMQEVGSLGITDWREPRTPDSKQLRMLEAQE